MSVCVHEREREEGERERKVSTNLFSALIGTVCRCSYFNATGICTQYSRYVFPCTVYSLDHMCHQDPGWSQVDTDSLCKHHTRHWASWIDSQCTHTSTRIHTSPHNKYVNAKFLILTHKMINIH